VHPRLQSGACVRPLNFTVRSHLPSAMPYSQSVVLPYVGVLLAICAAGGAYTQFSANAQLKRIVWPVTMVATAALFLVMLLPAVRPQDVAKFWFIPVIIGGSLFLTYRSVKFCSRCGATSRGATLRPAKFCSKCGAELGK
jgi:hypothetical protein